MRQLPDIDGLRTLLERIEPIPDEEWRWLQHHVHLRHFAAGERLFSEGDADANGREHNHAFASDDNLVGCLPVLAGQPRCPLNVEALEPTTTRYIDAAAIGAFHTRHACWSRLYARLMEHVALRKSARERDFLQCSAEQRYRACLADYASLVDRIPQYHLASYVGVTPVALSRIRRRINPG